MADPVSAFGLVVTCAGLVERLRIALGQVPANRRASKLLLQRCEELLHLLQDSGYQSQLVQLQTERLRVLEGFLHETESAITASASQRYLWRFVRRSSIQEKIQNAHARLDLLLEQFHLASQIAANEWQRDVLQAFEREEAEERRRITSGADTILDEIIAAIFAATTSSFRNIFNHLHIISERFDRLQASVDWLIRTSHGPLALEAQPRLHTLNLEYGYPHQADALSDSHLASPMVGDGGVDQDLHYVRTHAYSLQLTDFFHPQTERFITMSQLLYSPEMLGTLATSNLALLTAVVLSADRLPNTLTTLVYLLPSHLDGIIPVFLSVAKCHRRLQALVEARVVECLLPFLFESQGSTLADLVWIIGNLARYQAALILRRPDVVTVLLRLLRDPHPAVRDSTAKTILELCEHSPAARRVFSERAVEELGDPLAYTDSPYVLTWLLAVWGEFAIRRRSPLPSITQEKWFPRVQVALADPSEHAFSFACSLVAASDLDLLALQPDILDRLKVFLATSTYPFRWRAAVFSVEHIAKWHERELMDTGIIEIMESRVQEIAASHGPYGEFLGYDSRHALLDTVEQLSYRLARLSGRVPGGYEV